MESEKLIRENSELQDEINAMNKLISNFEQQIKNNNKIIFKKCKHDWEYESDSGMDRTRYFCKKCTLWKNPRWYQ
jgi:predicted RNase H-like nuclease (RuvC/YqgF family)